MVSIAVGVLIFAVVANVKSQETTPSPTSPPTQDFDAAHKEYLISTEEFKNAQQDYILKRSQFERFGTLKARQDLIEATRLMLNKEDEVVVSYYQAMIHRLDEAIGISPEVVNKLKTRIEDEIIWFNSHKENLSTAASLQDLEGDSEDAHDRWKSVDSLNFETLSHFPYGRILDFGERVDEVFLEIKTKVDEIREDKREGYTFSDRKIQILDRWLFQTQGKVDRSKEKKNQAEALIAEYGIKQVPPLFHYDAISSNFTESQILMKEAMSYLKEVIREIKTAED